MLHKYICVHSTLCEDKINQSRKGSPLQEAAYSDILIQV